MSKPYFDKVCIVGVGLIGGSLAIELKGKGMAGTVVGVGRGKDNLETAVKRGIIDSYTHHLDEGVIDCDLVVIAVPVLATAAAVNKASSNLKKGCIVTDVGSVKKSVIETVEPVIPEGVHFVPAHPIAGTEHSGAEHAFAGLYENRRCIITPTDNTDNEALGKITEMWKLVGSEVIIMDAEEHDIILAGISHLPHVVAYTLVNTIAKMEDKTKKDIIKYSAGGFKDFTRIASSSPEMWKDICEANKDAILKSIETFSRTLSSLEASIVEGNWELVRKAFMEAKNSRDSLQKD